MNMPITSTIENVLSSNSISIANTQISTSQSTKTSDLSIWIVKNFN